MIESMWQPPDDEQNFVDFLSSNSNESEVRLLAAINELNWSHNYSKQVYNFLNILLYQIPHNMVDINDLDRFVPDPTVQVRLLTDESFSDRIRQEVKPVH